MMMFQGEYPTTPHRIINSLLSSLCFSQPSFFLFLCFFFLHFFHSTLTLSHFILDQLHTDPQLTFTPSLITNTPTALFSPTSLATPTTHSSSTITTKQQQNTYITMSPQDPTLFSTSLISPTIQAQLP